MADTRHHCRGRSGLRSNHRPSDRTSRGYDLFGWRYFALDDVVYERRTLLLGGSILLPLTGVMSFLANRRRRHEAERLAAPQWRALGPMHVVVTDQRLLVWFDGEWSSVWLASVTDVQCHPDGALDLFFDVDPPYRFSGPDSALFTKAVTDSGVCEQSAQSVLESIQS